MKIKLNYETEAMVLPISLLEHTDKATKKDLRALLALAAEPMARVDLEAAMPLVMARSGLKQAELEASLAFWRGTGLLLLDEADEQVQPAPKPEAVAAQGDAEQTKPLVVADQGLPLYSGDELSAVLERRAGLASLIDESQRVLGKIFNTSEVRVIAGMVDYLSLDDDYILLLLSHCVRMDKKSLRYAEKMAVSLYDEGITNAKELELRLHRIEVMASAAGKIRAMFGISSRALTTREKEMIEKWLCTMCFEDDVLQKAYEITVDSTGKASIPYANKILERWYAEGYRSLSDVEGAIAEYRRKKNEGSFDVDDFFEAALKRTYG